MRSVKDTHNWAMPALLLGIVPVVGEIKRLSHRPGKNGFGERLGDDGGKGERGVEASSFAGYVQGVTTKGQALDAWTFPRALNRSDPLPAIHLGHVDVGNHHVERLRVEQRPHVERIPGRFEVFLIGQELLHEQEVDRIVVYNQESEAFGKCRKIELVAGKRGRRLCMSAIR